MNGRKNKKRGTESKGQTQTLQNRIRDAFRRGLQWKWEGETGPVSSGQRGTQRNVAPSQGCETADSSSQRHWPHLAPVAVQRFRRLFSSHHNDQQLEQSAANQADSLDGISVGKQSAEDMVRMKTQEVKSGEKATPEELSNVGTFPVTASSLTTVPDETATTSRLESLTDSSGKQTSECTLLLSNVEGASEGEESAKRSKKLQCREELSIIDEIKASDEKNLSSNYSDNQPIDCDVDRNDLLRDASEADSDSKTAAGSCLGDLAMLTNNVSICPENDSVPALSKECFKQNVKQESGATVALSAGDIVIQSQKSSSNPSIILSTETGKSSDPCSKKLAEPLYLNIDSSSQPAILARKSPVTVQEWVDSIPLSTHLEEDPEQTSNEEELSLTVSESQGDVCPSVTVRPAFGQKGTAADQKREAFSRDVSPSLQSDTGSHGSSVDSYLEARRPDPEEVLLGLGFGGALHNTEAEVSRIPARFLQPSKVKGVAIDDFLRYQQDLIETFESGYSGYRGLTGGAQIPSVIVAKIMEKLREHERESSVKSSAGSSPGHHAEIARRRFSRAAQRVTILTKMKSRDSIASGPQAHSVLNPDNRKFLDNQGSKSPEVLRKRMIIGHKSFTFDGEGQLIETETNLEEINVPETIVPSKPPPPRPLLHNDSVLSSATSLSLTSHESDSDTDETGTSGGERNNGEISSAINDRVFRRLLSTPVPTGRPSLSSSVLTNTAGMDGENIVDKRRQSLPSASDLLNSIPPQKVLEQAVCNEITVPLNGKSEVKMMRTSTPEQSCSWRVLHRTQSAPTISPVGIPTNLRVLQTHKEESNFASSDLTDKNIVSQKKFKIKNICASEKKLTMPGTPKNSSKAVSKKISPIQSGHLSNYEISDFVLPDDAGGPLNSPESQSSPSTDNSSNQQMQRYFSMPKSSAMFLEKELRRKLSLNSSVDSHVARSVANSPDLRNWSTSSVSSWESERDNCTKIDEDEVIDEDQCVFVDQNPIPVSMVQKSDLNIPSNHRRASLKRQQNVDEEDSSNGLLSSSNLKVDIPNIATDQGDSFEMEELAVEDDVRGFRTGSAHSDSSGFQEEQGNNKGTHRATLGKQLSESEPMLHTQLFPDESPFIHSVEHLKRLSLPVIRVQDESGLTQWRTSINSRVNFSLSSLRRVHSLPAQISQLGLGRFSGSITPGSLSDSIGNMFSSCSDESVIHLPRRSIDITSDSDQTELPPLPTAIVDYKGEVEALCTPRDCCKCHLSLKKSLTKCHNDLSLSQVNIKSFLSISEGLETMREAQNRIKFAMEQTQKSLCSSNECKMTAAFEQVSLVIEQQSNLCQQLEYLILDLLSKVKTLFGESACNSSDLSQNSKTNDALERSPSVYEHSTENCMLLCQVVEKENRRLRELVQVNVDELARVRELLERLLPDVKT